MNILLAAILLTNVAILTIFLVIFLKMSRAFNEVRGIYDDFIKFISPVDEKTPSQFASLVSTIADSLARSIMAQAKATFMGLKSGVARGESAIEADVAEAALQASNPGIAAILDAVPGLKKTLRRNPGLIDVVMSKFGGASKVVTAPGNGHSNNQMNFKL